eukprot:TRINITY_DN965_c0_g2_i1.p1 TRINITY_DN965_c0_g2~~TRINITY_DN965_c0_g2_i1.p1  ORF type:complete len:128 (+),score=18.63 TRINITY_DN965_c0_g2_i1:482-865(+)
MFARLLRRPMVAAPSTVVRLRGLEEFFEGGRAPGEKVVTGRGWEAWELRQKSFSDLHKLWYVLLKEKNLLASQKEMLRTQGMRFPDKDRMIKVRQSMCRIKQVLTERALAESDPDKVFTYKLMINAM